MNTTKSTRPISDREMRALIDAGQEDRTLEHRNTALADVQAEERHNNVLRRLLGVALSATVLLSLFGLKELDSRGETGSKPIPIEKVYKNGETVQAYAGLRIVADGLNVDVRSGATYPRDDNGNITDANGVFTIPKGSVLTDVIAIPTLGDNPNAPSSVEPDNWIEFLDDGGLVYTNASIAQETGTVEFGKNPIELTVRDGHFYEGDHEVTGTYKITPITPSSVK